MKLLQEKENDLEMLRRSHSHTLLTMENNLNQSAENIKDLQIKITLIQAELAESKSEISSLERDKKVNLIIKNLLETRNYN